ncbi:MAG: response regulator transcription factor [Candidatus Obscuribacterales bacterium]|nr:response regulator transcription factor [Candidatus Obscuribacterales bacterium]
MTPAKVIVVEHDELIRVGLVHVLNQCNECSEAIAVSTAASALNLLSENQIQVAIVGNRIPDSSAARLISIIREKQPDLKTIAVLEELEDFWTALSCEADGYLMRHMPSYQLNTAIRAVLDGYGWIDVALARYLIKRGGRSRLYSAAAIKPLAVDQLKVLTEREREVLHLLSDGYNSLEIAEKLAISRQTVKLHISSCIRKLGVKDRTQATAAFLRAGMLYN